MLVARTSCLWPLPPQGPLFSGGGDREGCMEGTGVVRGGDAREGRPADAAWLRAEMVAINIIVTIRNRALQKIESRNGMPKTRLGGWKGGKGCPISRRACSCANYAGEGEKPIFFSS